MIEDLASTCSDNNNKNIYTGNFLPLNISDSTIGFLNIYFDVDSVDILAYDNSLDFIVPLSKDKISFNFYGFLEYSRKNFTDSILPSTPSDILRWYYGKEDWSIDEVEIFLKIKKEVLLKNNTKLLVPFVLFGDWTLASKKHLDFTVQNSKLVNSSWLQILDDGFYLFNFSEYEKSKAI